MLPPLEYVAGDLRGDVPTAVVDEVAAAPGPDEARAEVALGGPSGPSAPAPLPTHGGVGPRSSQRRPRAVGLVTAAVLDDLRAAFDEAASRVAPVEATIDLAGEAVRFRVAGAELATTVLRPFAPLRTSAEPVATVDL